jgi:hypothetical protein
LKFTSKVTSGRIVEVYNSKYSIESVPDRSQDDYFMTEKVDKIKLDFAGIIGERHYGLTMIASTRDKHYQKGTEIKNNKQWTAISLKNLREIENNLNLENEEIDAGYLGYHILVEGIDKFSNVARGSYLIISPYSEFKRGDPENIALIVHGEIIPCTIAGKSVELNLENRKIASKFPKAANGIRGLRGWVEVPGIVKAGQYIHLLEHTGRT